MPGLTVGFQISEFEAKTILRPREEDGALQ